MINLIVTCHGEPSTRFDRNYYVNQHLPLTLKLWSPYGLETAAAFFPPGDGTGTLSIGVYGFRDEAAIHAALAAPETVRVMDDVPHFTDAKEILRFRALPL